MMGALFAGHPWYEAPVKLDDPTHPLLRVFEGQGFWFRDEMYKFRDPYSRDRLRVLLSFDMSKLPADAPSYHTRGGGAVALQPTATGLEAELAWENPRLNCEHAGYVIIDGYLYMNQGVGWSCLELKTGEERWSGRGPGKGSVIYADGMLYCLGEKGKMGLLEASPEEFKLVSMFDLPMGEGPCWTHPVIADGKLYLRWDDNLYVYDIKE